MKEVRSKRTTKETKRKREMVLLISTIVSC